jgi:hypothetical protein
VRLRWSNRSFPGGHAATLTNTILAEAQNVGVMTRYASYGVAFAEVVERDTAPDATCQFIVAVGDSRLLPPCQGRPAREVHQENRGALGEPGGCWIRPFLPGLIFLGETSMAVHGANTKWYLKEYEKLQLDEMCEYLGTVRTAMDKEFERFCRRVKRSSSKMSPDDAAEFEEWHADTAFALSQRFPRLVRQTAFVATYSFLECELVNYCEHIRTAKGFKKSVDDMHGLGIHAARAYLTSQSKIRLPKKDPDWKRILRLGEIRNAIVHNLGQVDVRETKDKKKDAKTKELRNFLRATPTIATEGLDRVVLSEQFCLDAIETVRAFLTKVLDLIPDELFRDENPLRGLPIKA